MTATKSNIHSSTATPRTVLVLDDLDRPIEGARRSVLRGRRRNASTDLLWIGNGHIPTRNIRGAVTTLRLLMKGAPTRAPFAAPAPTPDRATAPVSDTVAPSL